MQVQQEERKMAKYRQHTYSPAYLNGVEAATVQLANKGMGFPETAKDCSPMERTEFFKGYHSQLSELQERPRQAA
jgi:hypothetical protein